MILLEVVAGCGEHPGSVHGAAITGSRVSVVNGQLALDGHMWWPMGFDAYQLGTNWTMNEGCGAEVNLDAYFGSLPPHSATRFNLYSSFALNKHTNAVDFSALDPIFAAAERHDQLVIAVLASGEGPCEDGAFKDYGWYAGGWKSTSRSTPMPYAAWLDAAVRRWGASSALAGWDLVGEPEPSVCIGVSCDFARRQCPRAAAEVLRTFFDGAGKRVRELDADAPIWEGLAGGGQCGSRGDEYSFVGSSQSVDVLDLHDYGPPGVPLPGGPDDGVQGRIDQARELGKRLVVAEIGQRAGSCGSVGERARDLARKVSAQRAAGTAGALFWAFVPDPRPDDCTLDIGPGDPLFGVLKSATG